MKKKKFNKSLVILYSFLIIFLLIAILGIIIIFCPADTSEENSVLSEYDYDIYKNEISVSETDNDSDICLPPSDDEEELICIPFLDIDYDYDAMKATNEDFVGWLYIPDTPISYPVVQGKDNSQYLYHSFTGYPSAYGCLFFDYKTAGTINRVIHGHNMGYNLDVMFTTLLEYQDQEYAEAHKYIYFSEEPDVTDVYQVFAVVNFNIYNLDEFDYLRTDFSVPGQDIDSVVSEHTDYLQNLSVYETDYIPSGDIIVLSTCNRAYGSSNRLLVCAAKIN